MPSHPQSPISFHDIVTQLRQLTAERFSGSFRAEQGGVVKVLYLCDGRLACASSTDRSDRLGTLLEREGLITAEQLETAQEQALPGEALGSVLMNLGYIESEDLLQGARLQVEGVLGSILLWKEGAFRSRPGPLPERAVNLKLELGPVLMTCIERIEDDETVAGLLGRGDLVLCALPAAGDDDLGSETALLIDLLDGSRDLDSVCAQADMAPSKAARMVLGLKALGILEEGPAVAAKAFAGMDEPEAQPQPNEESLAHGDGDDSLEEATDPEEVWQAEPEPSSMETPAADPPLASQEDAAPVARRDLPRTLDEEKAEGVASQLPFDEQGGFDRHLDDEEPDHDEAHDVGGGSPEGPPPPGGESPRPRRGWILGAALPLLALLLVFVFSGGDSQPPLNTATGDPAPGSGMAPSDPSAGETPSPLPATEPSHDAGVQVPPPPPADVAIPKPEGTLESSSGYQAGFDAFQAGDFGKAAALWQRDWQSRPAGGFTLQVMVACEEATLRNLRPRIPTSDRLFLAPVRVNDGTCYKVLWGTYASRAQAESAAATVPMLFTSGGSSPWPVPLSSLEP